MSDDSPLTPKQTEILTLLAHGMTFKQIAVRVHISRRTVKAHVHNACERLGAQSREEAIAIAVQTEIIVHLDNMQDAYGLIT